MAQPDTEEETRIALFKHISEAADGLKENAGASARAEGLKDLAEAYAWLTVPNNSH